MKIAIGNKAMWGWMAVIAVSPAAEGKDLFKPTPDQQLHETQAWNRWQELASQRYFLEQFVAPEIVSAIVTPHMTDLLKVQRGRIRTTETLTSFLVAMTQRCGAWAMAQPGTLTLTSKEGAPVVPGRHNPAILLTGGLSGLNEEDWKFLTRRSGGMVPGRILELITVKRERQLEELDTLKVEVEVFAQLLSTTPELLQRMHELAAEAWLAYEAKFVLELRGSTSAKDLAERLRTGFASSPPEWPHVEQRILSDCIPGENQFPAWKAAVMRSTQSRVAAYGKLQAREIPNAFALKWIDSLTKKRMRNTRAVVPMDEDFREHEP